MTDEQQGSNSTSTSSTRSSPNWKTLFGDFKGIGEAKAFHRAMEQEYTTGVAAINSPTPDGGARIAIQVDLPQYEAASALLTSMGGKLGPSTGPRSGRVKMPKAEKPAKETKEKQTRQRKQKPICPVCKEPKGNLEVHMKRRHPDYKEGTDGSSDSPSGRDDSGDEDASGGKAAEEGDQEGGDQEEGSGEEDEVILEEDEVIEGD